MHPKLYNCIERCEQYLAEFPGEAQLPLDLYMELDRLGIEPEAMENELINRRERQSTEEE